MDKIPDHVAIIMDGNGRWANSKGLPREEGHKEGARSVNEIVTVARELGIKHLTLYSFSTENWKRPANEVRALMSLLLKYLIKERKTILQKEIRFQIIGQIDRLPSVVQKTARELIKDSSSYNPKMTLNIAVSYGGRQELTYAIQNIAKDVASRKLTPESITEDLISSYLYTKGQPDPDLLIRTSGELRISNFLLWQIAYSELYVTPTLWPDFRRAEFVKALDELQQRQRRFGGLVS